jgi:hypothetical protein
MHRIEIIRDGRRLGFDVQPGKLGIEMSYVFLTAEPSEPERSKPAAFGR